MCVFVCISHTCRNLNFVKNVTTLLHWADDMKCLINSVKNSSSKKKKKIPTDLPYFCSARYANITIFFFWPVVRAMQVCFLFWKPMIWPNPSLNWAFPTWVPHNYPILIGMKYVNRGRKNVRCCIFRIPVYAKL